MPLSTGTVLKRGFLRRCPVCGGGHLFRRWVRMIPNCPRCGYRFHRKPGQWLGSWFLNVCVAQTVVVVALATVAGISWPNTPLATLIALTVVLSVVTPVAFFPFSRTIWIAIDLAMKPLDFDDDVAPGFELEAELAELLAEGSGPPGPTSRP